MEAAIIKNLQFSKLQVRTSPGSRLLVKVSGSYITLTVCAVLMIKMLEHFVKTDFIVFETLCKKMSQVYHYENLVMTFPNQNSTVSYAEFSYFHFKNSQHAFLIQEITISTSRIHDLHFTKSEISKVKILDSWKWNNEFLYYHFLWEISENTIFYIFSSPFFNPGVGLWKIYLWQKDIHFVKFYCHFIVHYSYIPVCMPNNTFVN